MSLALQLALRQLARLHERNRVVVQHWHVCPGGGSDFEQRQRLGSSSRLQKQRRIRLRLGWGEGGGCGCSSWSCGGIAACSGRCLEQRIAQLHTAVPVAGRMLQALSAKVEENISSKLFRWH